MSQENVELVRREYGALAARDWIAIAEIWHPEIELEASRAAPGAGVYRGTEQITQFYDSALAQGSCGGRLAQDERPGVLERPDPK